MPAKMSSGERAGWDRANLAAAPGVLSSERTPDVTAACPPPTRAVRVQLPRSALRILVV